MAAIMLKRWSNPRGYILTVRKASLEVGWESISACPPDASWRPHRHGVVPCADGEMVICLVGPPDATPAAMQTEMERVVTATDDAWPGDTAEEA